MKDELIREELGERLDDLQCENLFLIQNPAKFCFGIDAVLLANFIKAKRGGHAVDLCTGSGIVPVLLSAKTQAKKITGIEIQEDIAEMANRSVKYNSLEEKITELSTAMEEVGSDAGRLMELHKEQEAAEASLQEQYAIWEESSLALEELEEG